MQFRSDAECDSEIYDVSLCSLPPWRCLNRLRVAVRINHNQSIAWDFFARFVERFYAPPSVREHWMKIAKSIRATASVFHWKLSTVRRVVCFQTSLDWESSKHIAPLTPTVAFLLLSNKIDSLTYSGFSFLTREFSLQEIDYANISKYQSHLCFQHIKWWFQHLAHLWRQSSSYLLHPTPKSE